MDVVLSILLPAVGMHSHNDVLSDEDISSFLNLSPSENTQPGKVFLFFKTKFDSYQSLAQGFRFG